MRIVLASLAILALSACQKDLSEKQVSLNAETVSNDALTPLACHTTSLSIEKAAEPGQVPPFRFTKTLYSDTRVKTINMLSRVYPIHSAFKKHAVELIGTFTYGPGVAYLKGTSQVWEYYKTSAGAGARRSIGKKNVNYKFYFLSSGYCYKVTDQNISDPAKGEDEKFTLLELYYLTHTAEYPNGNALGGISVHYPGDNSNIFLAPRLDQYGNITDFGSRYGEPENVGSRVAYTYDYAIPRGSKQYSFIPSQNLISQEYSLLEVMQWVPQPTHQRKTVAGIFFLDNGTKVVQSQVYKNYRFDTRGNQVSVTYGDNIPQKTTWYCK
jgi:hypothetical protein